MVETMFMENHHPSTLLSMDPTGGPPPPPASSSSHDDSDRELMIQTHHPLDINLPPSAEPSTMDPHLSWGADLCDILVGLVPQVYEAETILTLPKATGAVKGVRRGESIWGAWFFFNFYFKPALNEKSKGKISSLDRYDLWLYVFLVQHDMENMYMWIFKERPENALGKMQLRSYMNGHSRLGQPEFPFSPEKGFIRSHRMQRRHYSGLSNPQCVHGIDVVRLLNLMVVSEVDPTSRSGWSLQGGNLVSQYRPRLVILVHGGILLAWTLSLRGRCHLCRRLSASASEEIA